MRATLTSKGQVTLPAELRERLGLHKGDQIDFVLKDGEWVVRPVREETENPFLRFVGIAPLPDGMTAVEWVRSIRDDEE